MSKRTNLKSWLLILVFSLGITCTATAGTIFVDASATGANNGSSWADAYNYLQDALTAATSGDEIWAAEGTYYPDANTANPEGTGDQTATFQLVNGVSIYGGFPSGGGVWSQRDPNAYQAVLSGDLDGDDEPDFVNINDNSFHIVTCDEVNGTATLDGFTISSGNASLVPDDSRGAGMNCSQSSPTITDCSFVENRALGGAAIYNYDSNPNLFGCFFSGNSSIRGGAVYNYSSSPMLTGCTFSRNKTRGTSGEGGALYNEWWSKPRLTDCVFTKNTSENGGGIYSYSYSNAIITNCMFYANSGSDCGGGIYAEKYSDLTVTNCMLIGNWSWESGGGIYLKTDCDPVLVNCVFIGNESTYGRGTLDTTGLVSHPLLVNCSIVSTGGLSGGGGALTLTNCIVWDTGFGSGSPSVTYSCINDSDPNDASVYPGTGNIDDNPMFVRYPDPGPDEYWGTADDDFGDLRLSSSSPCIDTGYNNSVSADTADLDNDGDTVEPIPFDLDSRDRIVDGDCNDTNIVDMGAYEFSYLYLGDFYGDCDVDFADFAVFAMAWMTEPGDTEWNPNCDISIPADNFIDMSDLAVFAENWLAGVE